MKLLLCLVTLPLFAQKQAPPAAGANQQKAEPLPFRLGGSTPLASNAAQPVPRMPDGTVDLWGFVASDDEKKATRIAVESIPGVKTINDHLTIPPPEIAMV